MTALHTAVESGHADVVEILLLAGADADSKEKVGDMVLAAPTSRPTAYPSAQYHIGVSLNYPWRHGTSCSY